MRRRASPRRTRTVVTTIAVLITSSVRADTLKSFGGSGEKPMHEAPSGVTQEYVQRVAGEKSHTSSRSARFLHGLLRCSSADCGHRDCGLVFGREVAQGQIVSQISGLVGREGAEIIQTIVENARKPSASRLGRALTTSSLRTEYLVPIWLKMSTWYRFSAKLEDFPCSAAWISFMRQPGTLTKS